MWDRLLALFSRHWPGAGQGGAAQPATPGAQAGETGQEDSDRRAVRDRRNEARRLDERRKAGIGEIIEDRRAGPRRDMERREPEERRERRSE